MVPEAVEESRIKNLVPICHIVMKFQPIFAVIDILHCSSFISLDSDFSDCADTC